MGQRAAGAGQCWVPSPVVPDPGQTPSWGCQHCGPPTSPVVRIRVRPWAKCSASITPLGPLPQKETAALRTPLGGQVPRAAPRRDEDAEPSCVLALAQGHATHWEPKGDSTKVSSVQFSRSVMFNSLRPHEPQHARPPCPSPTPGVHPNPCPLSQ